MKKQRYEERKKDQGKDQRNRHLDIFVVKDSRVRHFLCKIVQSLGKHITVICPVSASNCSDLS